MKRIPFDCADHGERRASAAPGELNHSHARPERAARFGALDHREGHPIFVRTGGVEVLELHEDIGARRRHEPAKPHHGRAANRREDGIDRSGRRHAPEYMCRPCTLPAAPCSRYTALMRKTTIATVLAAAWALAAGAVADGQRGGGNPFPGGTNPDGSLRPTAPLTRLFTQDAYTEYAILDPGSEAFRIRFLPEETRTGATELVNATRGGSEGSDIEVYDPRTGKPMPFTYEADPKDPETHAIHAKLPIPVPAGGIGRVLIYKTYKDARTYMMNGKDIVWVRSLSGYRLGVLLPKGFAFISSNVAAQLSTTGDGRLKLAFANPSGQSNPVTIHARRTSATFTPTSGDDMFFDDVKTVYDLGAPETHKMTIDQSYSDYRKGAK